MTKNEAISYIQYLSPFFFFIVDVISFAFFEKPLLYSLLCFYCIEISERFVTSTLLLSLLGLSLESFLFYGRFGIQLLYLLPLWFLGSFLHGILYKNRSLKFGILILALLVQSVGIEWYLLGLNQSFNYTISKIFVNLAMLYTISLTYE